MRSVEIDLIAHGGATFRTLVNIAAEWRLNVDEQMLLLAISDRHRFDDLKVRTAAHERVEVPFEILERLDCVLSIYASLRTLSFDGRAAGWIRDDYNFPPFGGRAPLALMCGDFADLDSVAKFFPAQIHSSGSVWPPDPASGVERDDYRVVFVDDDGA